MRWLLLKDLRILRRSPSMSVLLVLYPVAVALMIGFALSSPAGKPKVAFYTAVPPGQGTIHIGGQSIDIAGRASQLFRSITPLKVDSQAAAIKDVREGRALAALIIPGDIASQIESLVASGVGRPTVQLILNSRDPLERQYVQAAIESRLGEVEVAVSKQVLRVAIGDLQQVLEGGDVQLLGLNVRLLGLRRARDIVQNAIGLLPAASPLRANLRRVVAFANLAIAGLAFASPVLGSINQPLTIQQTQLAGATTPTATYAAAIAVAVSLMFIVLLLAADLLALERAENTYLRLVRGPLSPLRVLAAKVLLAAGVGALAALLMAAVVSSFVHLDWGRVELWLLVLAVAALAFAALGVAIGALARDVAAASLLVILLGLPIAFVALIPGSALSSSLRGILTAVSFVFPFRASLQGLGSAFSAAPPSVLGPLVHLVVQAAGFAAIGRLALRGFARV
jgi:ABC-type transport system involved in cytochrome c biogenesis permease component